MKMFLFAALVFSVCHVQHLNALTPAGVLVTPDLEIGAVIQSLEKGEFEAQWHKGAEALTGRGDKVIWGYFHAEAKDVAWGSANNPEVFVKIWFDYTGRVDVNFFHVSVPDIKVYSWYHAQTDNRDHQQQHVAGLKDRYVRHYYYSYRSHSMADFEIISDDGNSAGLPNHNPAGYCAGNALRIGAMINTVEKGAIEAVWREGGKDTTQRGDQVVWGHFYADTNDVNWGDVYNPELFVKIWFDYTGRVDVNFFHVSVPDIEVYSDLPNDSNYNQKGLNILSDRYSRQEYASFDKNAPCDIDTDQDGMPDIWELRHGLDILENDAEEDPDQDGHSNIEEYLQDTDPVFNPETITGQLTRIIAGAHDPVISADGSDIAFSSTARLTADDTNDAEDIYVYDRQLLQTELVSKNSEGEPGDGMNTFLSSISADGQRILFVSDARNFVPDSVSFNVFVRDLLTAQTILISKNSQGNVGDNASEANAHALSADGRYVVFYSQYATNLIENDTTDEWNTDIYLHDLQTGTTRLISKDSEGPIPSHNRPLAISPDGQYALFNNFNVSGGFLYEAPKDDVLPVLSGYTIHEAVFSTDATYLAFIAITESNEAYLYVTELEENTVKQIAKVDRFNLMGRSGALSISAQGRYLVFPAIASDIPGTPNINNKSQIYLYDHQTGQIQLISRNAQNYPANDHCFSPSISSDGRTIVFYSQASNLDDGKAGIYLYSSE